MDKRIYNELPFPEPITPLREDQLLVYNQVQGSCFINALPGWGKSIAALHIAKKLGQKTLVVCHNTMLRDQWVEEVTKLYKMPVGVIGSGEFDIDHSVVIGNIQTLTKKLPELSKEFGTTVVDEAHHISASTFTSFLDGMHSAYKIALSGTIQRKDGKHVMFSDFFGPDLYQPPANNTMTPSIQVIKTGITLEGDGWAKKVNNLLYDKDYQQFVSRVVNIQVTKGHKVLVIADRVEFLENVANLVGPECVCITGGTTYEERMQLLGKIRTGEATSIAGSRQIFSEGISENMLSCVILAAPIANDSLLEQIVGRIMRMHEGKLDPLVIDMHFNGPNDRRQNKQRLDFYMRKGWEVKGL